MTEHERDLPPRTAHDSSATTGMPVGFGANQVPAEHEIDRQPTDRRLHEEVCTILMKNDLLPIAELDVAVDNGVVTLHGVTRDGHVRERAEEIVALIAGVRSVRNELRIAPL
jgi:osmotically-inducible protein OsmY